MHKESEEFFEIVIERMSEYCDVCDELVEAEDGTCNFYCDCGHEWTSQEVDAFQLGDAENDSE